MRRVLPRVSPDRLNAPVANELALEQLAGFRRLLVPRCAALAVAVSLAARTWPNRLPWWLAGALCLVVPAAVWILEVIRREGHKKFVSSHMWADTSPGGAFMVATGPDSPVREAGHPR